MMDCARTKGPCSGKPAPTAPVCIPPPPPPFPWIYPLALGGILAFIGAFYRFYLWREEQTAIKPPTIWRPRPKQKQPVHDEDLPACVQYLIVGTGAAAWAAYRAIMKHDEKAKVFFITNEDIYPYKRPPMASWMWYNGDPPDIRTLNYIDRGVRKTMYYTTCKTFMDIVKFYRKKIGPAVAIAIGWCVEWVDPEEHRIWVRTYCGYKPIYYERLLLAVGARPKNFSFYKSAPKFVRDRISTLRTIRDLEIAYRKVQFAKHVTVVGGGFIGTELAYFLGRMKEHWFPEPDLPEDYQPPQILHIYKGAGILHSVLPEYLAEWGAEKLKCQTVTVMPRTQVYDAFESEDGRLQLTLSNGQTIVTDYVLVAIGITPREDIALKSHLEVDKKLGGIVVNTELQARKHLYVAGDAASIYVEWKDKRFRMESFFNAVEQGYIAGANMAGHWIPSNMEPHFMFNLPGDIDMELIGEVGACMTTVGLFRPCEEMETEDERRHLEKLGEYKRPCYKDSEAYRLRYKRGIVFYLRDNIVVGMVFWNFKAIEDRYEVVTEMLRAQPTYDMINMLAELLGFEKVKCEITEADNPPKLTCIDMDKVSQWAQYEDYDKYGQLSTVETPETVLYKNQPL